MRQIILLFLTILSFSSSAQNVKISGNAPTYYGKNIIVYKYKDFISKEKQILANPSVDNTGDFTFNYNTKKTELIFIDTGFFILSLYVYPNQNENISIPEYQEKPARDIYFKPIELATRVNTDNKNELNNLIRDFNHDLSILNDKYFDAIYNKNKSVIDKIKKELDSKYSSKNKYFNTYKKYAIGICEFPIYAENIKPFIKKYFSGKTIYNDQFFELFNKTFSNYLSYEEYKKTPNLNAHKIYNIQASKLRKEGISNNNLIDLIILKSLKDGAFNPVLKKELYINTVRYIRKKSQIQQTKTIASNIIENVTYLSKGYACPEIIGKDHAGRLVNTHKQKGKYLYYMFHEKSTLIIEEDLKVVARVADRKDYLKVLIICDEKNKERNIKELKKYKLDDNAVFCTNYKALKEKFKVIVTPSYFLVDKKGNIIQSHTIRPRTNLFKNLNNIDIKELRNGHNKKSKYFN